MRRFFVPPEKLKDPVIALTGSQAHHLRSVLRLQADDEVIVFDGAGRQWLARILSVDHRQVRLQALAPFDDAAEPGLELVVGQGYLKDKKMDVLVRQFTELGVARMIPFQSIRSVPVPDPEKQEKRRERWRRISLEALKQCRRAHPVIIDERIGFEAVLDAAATCELKLLLWENSAGAWPCPDKSVKTQSVFLMIGPEGGFETAETDLAQSRGFHVVGLGPRILRAETAAVAACAIAQHLYGDVGQ